VYSGLNVKIFQYFNIVLNCCCFENHK